MELFNVQIRNKLQVLTCIDYENINWMNKTLKKPESQVFQETKRIQSSRNQTDLTNVYNTKLHLSAPPSTQLKKKQQKPVQSESNHYKSIYLTISH